MKTDLKPYACSICKTEYYYIEQSRKCCQKCFDKRLQQLTSLKLQILSGLILAKGDSFATDSLTQRLQEINTCIYAVENNRCEEVLGVLAEVLYDSYL